MIYISHSSCFAELFDDGARIFRGRCLASQVASDRLAFSNGLECSNIHDPLSTDEK